MTPIAGSGALPACSRPCRHASPASQGAQQNRSTTLRIAARWQPRSQRIAAAPWQCRQSRTQLLPSAPPLPTRWRLRQRGAMVRPQAGLYSLPPDLYSSLQTGCGIAFIMGLCFSALPILTGESLERNQRRFQSPDADEGAENIRWSVMGVLSVLPFINPMAWVFAALDDDEASVLYYSLAFIYALPYLANGFELDAFAFVSLLICALHIQVERVAQTEPVELELPSVLRRTVSGIPQALRSLVRYSSRLGGEVGSRTRSAEEARRRRPDRKYLEERSREARAELEEFDKRRRQRQMQQQRLWSQQEEEQHRQENKGKAREREREREKEREH